MTVRQRYEGIQTALEQCGHDGCHFLTLCSIADEWRHEHGKSYTDLIETIRVVRSKGWMRADFYVTADTQILRYLTGKKWTRKDVESLGPINDNDYTEAVYFNPRTQYKHYRRRYMDTLEHSVTVEEGYIVEYRIYTVQE